METVTASRASTNVWVTAACASDGNGPIASTVAIPAAQAGLVYTAVWGAMARPAQGAADVSASH